MKPTTPKDALEMLCAAVEVCAERDDVALDLVGSYRDRAADRFEMAVGGRA